MKGETFGPLEELELIYSDERIREEVSQVMENTSMGKRLFAWGEFGPAYQEITQIQGQVGEIESYVGIRDQEYTIHFQGETYGPFPPFEKYYKIGDRWYWFRETHEGWFYNQNEILQGPLYNPSRLWYVLDYPQGKYTQDGGDLLILAKSGPEEITSTLGITITGPIQQPEPLKPRFSDRMCICITPKAGGISASTRMAKK
jgi:hypothetical protein